MSGSSFKTFSNKSVDGILYTEPNAPSKVKYLKTVNYGSEGFYTLYGNSMANAFECKEDRNCIIYGGNGSDAFEVTEYSNTYVIKDFKKNNNADKIVIVGNGMASTPYIGQALCKSHIFRA